MPTVDLGPCECCGGGVCWSGSCALPSTLSSSSVTLKFSNIDMDYAGQGLTGGTVGWSDVNGDCNNSDFLNFVPQQYTMPFLGILDPEHPDPINAPRYLKPVWAKSTSFDDTNRYSTSGNQLPICNPGDQDCFNAFSAICLGPGGPDFLYNLQYSIYTDPQPAISCQNNVTRVSGFPLTQTLTPVTNFFSFSKGRRRFDFPNNSENLCKFIQGEEVQVNCENVFVYTGLSYTGAAPATDYAFVYLATCNATAQIAANPLP